MITHSVITSAAMMFDALCKAKRILVLSLLSALPLPGMDVALADGITPPETESAINRSEITDNALSNLGGIVSINQASGDGNAQANSRAIAIANNGGVAIAYTLSDQRSLVNISAMPVISETRITGTSFSDSHGLLAINQAAGVGNLQLNSFVVSGSIDGELTDAMLSETLTGMSAMPDSNGTRSNTQRTVSVDKTAFIGTSGVVQLSQVAGSGNVTRNRFEMSYNPQH